MTTPNPYDLPEFATDNLIDSNTGQNNVVEPAGSDKQFGWHPWRRRPPRNIMNWLHRLTYNSLDWLKNTFYPEVVAEFDKLKNYTNFKGVNLQPGAISSDSSSIDFQLSKMTVEVINPNDITDSHIISISGNYALDNASDFDELGGLKGYEVAVQNQYLYLFMIYRDTDQTVAFATDTDINGTDIKTWAGGPFQLYNYTHLRLIAVLPWVDNGGDKFADFTYEYDDYINYGDEQTTATPPTINTSNGASYDTVTLNLQAPNTVKAAPIQDTEVLINLRGNSAGATVSNRVRGKPLTGILNANNTKAVVIQSNSLDNIIHKLNAANSTIEHQSVTDLSGATFEYIVLGYKNPAIYL